MDGHESDWKIHVLPGRKDDYNDGAGQPNGTRRPMCAGKWISIQLQMQDGIDRTARNLWEEISNWS